MQGGNPGELKVMLDAVSLTKGGKLLPFICSSVFKPIICLCVHRGNPGDLDTAGLTKGGKAFAFHLQLNI